MSDPMDDDTMDRAAPRIVYSRHYNIGVLGLERLHPFDSRKYGRAFRVLRQRFGRKLRKLHVRPSGPISRDELLHVHWPAYLDQLQNPHAVARALELPVVELLPAWLVDRQILLPMRWATTGTVEAALGALKHGLAINLSGGYHHAKPDGGEGFCIYADIPLAIDRLRREGMLEVTDRIVCIDLDAHQGNGVCHCLRDDRSVFLFDMYNPSIYPAYDKSARMRLDSDVPVPAGSTGEAYLLLLRTRLPTFLDGVAAPGPIRLAIYNAGSDIYEHDQLGGLRVSHPACVERDWFVIDELRKRRIPCAMLLSGGYHRDSYRIIAESIANIIERTTDIQEH
jgi:histone deacetylase 11